MNIIKNWLHYKLAMLIGEHFSLNRKFRKNKAIALIHFIGDDNFGGSIKICCGGIEYFFEGKPEIEKYKNAGGEIVVKKKLKYGGWGIDLTAEENKIF